MKRYSLALVVAFGLHGSSTADANPFEKVCIERGACLPANAPTGPRYSVDRSSEPWVVSFFQTTLVRCYTAGSEPAYLETWCSPTVQHNLKHGQYLAARLNDGSWSWLSDADHR